MLDTLFCNTLNVVQSFLTPTTRLKTMGLCLAKPLMPLGKEKLSEPECGAAIFAAASLMSTFSITRGRTTLIAAAKWVSWPAI